MDGREKAGRGQGERNFGNSRRKDLDSWDGSRENSLSESRQGHQPSAPSALYSWSCGWGAVWRGFQKSFGILLGPGSSLSHHPTSTSSPGPGRYKWASPGVREGQGQCQESVRTGELSPGGQVHERPQDPQPCPLQVLRAPLCTGSLVVSEGTQAWLCGFTGHLQGGPVKSADAGLAPTRALFELPVPKV